MAEPTSNKKSLLTVATLGSIATACFAWWFVTQYHMPLNPPPMPLYPHATPLAAPLKDYYVKNGTIIPFTTTDSAATVRAWYEQTYIPPIWHRDTMPDDPNLAFTTRQGLCYIYELALTIESPDQYVHITTTHIVRGCVPPE